MSIKKRLASLFSAFIALVAVLAVATPAFAASITINGAANGVTYTAYKIFDVSVSADGSSYSYYISTTTDNATLIELLDNKIGLDLDLTGDGSRYLVKVTKSDAGDDVFVTDTADVTMTAAELAQKLATNVKSLTAAGNATASGNTASIAGLADGYYFVDTTLGALCMLNTASGDTAQTINEKNTVPTITKKVYEDSTKSYGDVATIDVIDTVKYQLTVNTGTNSANLGTGIDDDYVITDVLPKGITINGNEENHYTVAIANWTYGTDYTVSYAASTNTLTITLLSTGKLGGLDQDANIVITYNATASSQVTLGAAGNTNKVTLSYKEQESPDTAVVKTYSIGGTAEAATITKVGGSETGSPLIGVKFVLSKGTGENVVYAKFDANGYLTDWVSNLAEATRLETDSKGNIFAHGLDADEYVLTETETLAGYNLLNDTISVSIAEDGTVTYKYTNSTDNSDNSIIIVNETGSLLPTTGGMGTTMLYAVGAALVIGTGVTLVVRRRMSNEA